MRNRKVSLWVTFACAALMMSLMTGCDGSDDTEASTASLPEGLFLTAAPAGPVAIQQLKTQVQAGDEVTMRVVAGGEVSVFVSGRAVMKVVDAEIKNLCLDMGDSCKTPWDYCCETADNLKRHRATIKVVDAQGKTIKMDLKGAGQVKELTTMIIKGVVAQGSDKNNLVVNAQGIYVEN